MLSTRNCWCPNSYAWVTLTSQDPVYYRPALLVGQYCFAHWHRSSSVTLRAGLATLHGGPVVLRLVRATPCCIMRIRSSVVFLLCLAACFCVVLYCNVALLCADIWRLEMFSHLSLFTSLLVWMPVAKVYIFRKSKNQVLDWDSSCYFRDLLWLNTVRLSAHDSLLWILFLGHLVTNCIHNTHFYLATKS